MDRHVLLDAVIEEFAIEPDALWPVDDSRLEPIFLNQPVWIDFDELPQPDLRPWAWEPAEPLFVGFEDFTEFDELDSERLEDPVDESLASPPQRASATSFLGSLGIHLVVLLVLLGWSRPTADMGPPIAVQLVVEAAAPTGPTPPDSNLPPAELVPKPTTEQPKPPMQTANEAVRPQSEPPTATPKPEPAPAPPKKVAAAAPPPKPKPARPPQQRKMAQALPPAAEPTPLPRREEPVAREPLPPPTPVPASAPAPAATPVPVQAYVPVPAPVPTPVSTPAAATYVPSSYPPREFVPASAPPVVRAPGTDESKGDYYETLRQLTRQHIDMLAAAFLNGRRGTTVLRILVMRDGAIAQISVAQSSGYSDVDARIEQMVNAVGHFPPLPAAFLGPSADLQLKLMFPDAVQ